LDFTDRHHLDQEEIEGHLRHGKDRGKDTESEMNTVRLEVGKNSVAEVQEWNIR
jgi:hypothetical protein